MIEAVIFDHDGTLVDSEPVHHQMWAATLAEHGVVLTRERYQTGLSGKPTIDSAKMLVAEHGLVLTAEDICNAKLSRIRAHLQTQAFPLIPPARELMQWLAAHNIPMAVASGAARDEVAASIAAHGLAPYLSAVSTRDDVQHNKPAPDVYLHAAAALGVAPARCVAIEDSDSGQLAAQQAGMKCLRIASFTTLPPHSNCFIINHLSDVQAWLAGRFNPAKH